MTFLPLLPVLLTANCPQVVSDAHKAMERLVGELEAIVRLSETAVAAATYGISKEDIIARTERISRRADVMRKVIKP